MKKTLFAALSTCLVATAGAVSAQTAAPNELQVSGSVGVEYRADRNTNQDFNIPDKTDNGLKITVLVNMNQQLSDKVGLFARFSYRHVGQELIPYADDFVGYGNDPATIDHYGLTYTNAGWNYKLGAQPLSFGATGLLYDDNRYLGKDIFNQALTATGKIGKVDVNTAIARSNYEGKLDNDNLYYVHTGYSQGKSKFGLGYVRANYGASTAGTELQAGDGSGLNYYTADFSYQLADNLHFSSEFIKSSADNDNTGANFVLFHVINPKSNVGVAWFRVEEQASVQQYHEGGMTYQWGNAQGYGLFYNYKLADNVTFSLTDFNMNKIKNSNIKSGMIGDQNTFRVGVSYNF